MMQAILECKNLTKKFGRKTALDDVSLQLKSGKKNERIRTEIWM